MRYLYSKYHKLLALFLITALFQLSSCEQAFEPDLKKEKVTLMAPADSLSIADSTPIFYWEPIKGATNYQLQIVSPQFGSIRKLYADTIISKNQLAIKLQRGIFQWRVRANNDASQSSMSDTFHLIIY